MRNVFAAYLALTTVFMLSAAHAQITNVTGDQAPPIPGAGHDYIHMLNETVNPGNGSVSLRIGTPVPPSRGFTMPFTFAYDSNATLHMTTFPAGGGLTTFGWADNVSYLGQGGWSYGVPKLSMVYNVLTGDYQDPWVCFYFTDYMLTDLAAGSHALGLSSAELLNNPQCGFGGGSIKPEYLNGADAQVQATTSAYNPTGNVTSPIPPAVTAVDMDGTVYYFSNSGAHNNAIPGSSSSGVKTSLPDWIEDRNGNKTVVSDQGNGAFTITDTAGRTTVSSSGFGTTGNTIAVTGLANPYQVTWQNFSSTANPLPLPWKQCVTTSNCATGNGPGTIVSAPRITQITLPNGQIYKFQYDPVSTLLSQLTYPGGGYVQYTWSAPPGYSDAISCGSCGVVQYTSFLVSKRIVSFDGVHSALEQDFSYVTTWGNNCGNNQCDHWSQRTTTVITKDLVRGTTFNTVYTYQPFPIVSQPNDVVPNGGASTPVETMIQYYDTNGALLRTARKTYAEPHLPPDVTTTLDNNQTFKTHNAYTSRQSGTTCTGTSCNLAVLTDSYDYDFGAGAPGALVRQTHVDYASFANTPIFPSAECRDYL